MRITRTYDDPGDDPGTSPRLELDLDTVRQAYRRHAPYYDAVFGLLLHPGRRRAVDLINAQAEGRVLEVGVGTGLSLSRYRSDLKVTGIDVSRDMLRQARERVAAKRLGNVEALLEMDAENLEFADGSFDVVVAMYVASVVPHPDRLLAEVQRVCRPDGLVIFVNHFAAARGLRSEIEKRLAGLSPKLGWRPDFSRDQFLQSGSLDVLESEQTPPLGLFTILRCRNDTLRARHGAPGSDHAFRN